MQVSVRKAWRLYAYEMRDVRVWVVLGVRSSLSLSLSLWLSRWFFVRTDWTNKFSSQKRKMLSIFCANWHFPTASYYLARFLCDFWIWRLIRHYVKVPYQQTVLQLQKIQQIAWKLFTIQTYLPTVLAVLFTYLLGVLDSCIRRFGTHFHHDRSCNIHAHIRCAHNSQFFHLFDRSCSKAVRVERRNNHNTTIIR